MILTKNELIQQATYYTPSQQVTVAASATETVTFQGYNGKKYGLNRFLVGGASDDLPNLLVTATILYAKGGHTIFSDVQANTLKELFLYKSLRGAFEIEEQTQLQVKIENTGSASITANVELVGYSAVQLANLKAQYAQQQKPFPEPIFLSVKSTITKNTTNNIVDITLPAQTLRLYRMAMGSDSDDNILVKIRQNRTYIKPQVFLSQINDEFATKDIILPIDLDSRIPFQLVVDNLDSANDHTISFLAETYQIPS